MGKRGRIIMGVQKMWFVNLVNKHNTIFEKVFLKGCMFADVFVFIGLLQGKFKSVGSAGPVTGF
jgi:hypothetical protein